MELSDIMEELTREYLTFNMDLEKNYKESEIDLPKEMDYSIPMDEIW